MSRDEFMKVSLSNKSVVDRIVDQLTNAIMNGELKPGDKIPTEPELCETFEVSRNSVREAIKILEAYGVVKIKRAEGTFISEGFSYKMIYPVLYGIILQGNANQQVVDLRKVIDIGILREAAEVIREPDLQELEAVLAQMQQACAKGSPDPAEIFTVDLKFHAVIVGILDNRMLESIGYYIDNITRRTRVMSIAEVLERRETDEFIRLHQEIIDTLREQRLEDIYRITDDHYKYWTKYGKE